MSWFRTAINIVLLFIISWYLFALSRRNIKLERYFFQKKNKNVIFYYIGNRL